MTTTKTDGPKRSRRWILVGVDGKTPTVVDGRHVFIDTALPDLARTLAARFLVARGATLDLADAAQVIEWKPNGWRPGAVVVITAAAGGHEAVEGEGKA